MGGTIRTELATRIALQYKRLHRSVEIAGKSQSTLTNYARCLAHMGLHLSCNLLQLDDEQILDYLHFLKGKHKTPPYLFRVARVEA